MRELERNRSSPPTFARRQDALDRLVEQGPDGLQALQGEHRPFRSWLPQVGVGKAIAETRVRYGYRRITVLLKREGWAVNGKRIYRLYKELGLQLRNKTPKRKVKAKLREDRRPASRPNDVWAMDFLHDQLFDGRKIRILAVIDTFSRFSPARIHGSRTRPVTWYRRSNGPERPSAICGSFVSTAARSLSPATSICGPTSAVSSSTSAAPAS